MSEVYAKLTPCGERVAELLKEREALQARIAKLEAELAACRREHHEVVSRYAGMIIKLRALIEPDMIALTRSLLTDVPVYDDDGDQRLNETLQISAWLDRLESDEPIRDLSEFRGMFPHDPDGPSSEERVRQGRDDESEES